jgi:M6 family metalloprotease-like protein
VIRTPYLFVCTFACLLAPKPLSAQESTPRPRADLSEYRTTEKAATVQIRKTAGGPSGQTGYLGVVVQRDAQGRLLVEEVQPDSPAARAGVKKGDVVTHVGEHAVRTADSFREWLQTRKPGESVRLGLQRDGQPVAAHAKLAATSRPMKISSQRAYLGAELADPESGKGARVERVAPDSPAAAAGLKVGDFVTQLDGFALSRAGRLTDLLFEKRPGDILLVTVRRDEKVVTLSATLTTDRGERGPGPPGGRRGTGGPGAMARGGPGVDAPPSVPWTKPVFRLAVVGIEYPDVKHNGKAAAKDWDEAFFSRGSYSHKDNATGQPVHGSLNDYFQEQSYGTLRITGKVFDWVEVGKKRSEYMQGSGTSNKGVLLLEALDKLSARDGKDALKEFDGVLFLYAGDRIMTNRGALYYPHAGSLGFQSRRLPYVLAPEGGSRMAPVGTFVKEFGRVLGLPDLAARTENIGSEGLGPWCAMSDPYPSGRPQHFCAWAKEKLGWIHPTAIDPTVKQKLILAPIEDSPRECFKVLVRPDGSEYFLLENRRKQGFDAALPGEGLLIWRVVNDRPILEEAHGVEGPSGPTVHLRAVPFPIPGAHAFTSDTTPSSRSPLGGGLPVHITEIRRLPDGRIAFHIGYKYH